MKAYDSFERIPFIEQIAELDFKSEFDENDESSQIISSGLWKFVNSSPWDLDNFLSKGTMFVKDHSLLYDKLEMLYNFA